VLSLVKKPHYQLIDFFPPCILPSCERFMAGEPHSHILPHQQTILESTAKFLYCQGGVGSAKSIAFAVKSVYLSLSIPENRGIVSRFHYDDLFDSSWRDIKAVIARLVDAEKIPQPAFSKKIAGDYTQILFHNGSEMKAVQGKNWHRGLGASHGWFWIDDGMEALEEFFIGNETSAGLLSRLRLAHIHYHRGCYDLEKRPHGALQGMISTNPPPHGHFLHKLFGNKPGVHLVGEDTVEWLQVSTTDNPFMGADYAKGLIAIQSKMGHNTNTARRVIFGESIPAYGGIPVFPQFNHAKHVAPLRFRSDLPLIRGFDFGFLHPAVIYGNLYKCKSGTNHFFTLSETADCFSATVYTLYDKYVKPHTDALYKDAPVILNAGDRAGYRASSSNKDRRGDMKILIDEYHIPFKWRHLELNNSLQYIRSLLQPRHECKCGLPLVLISNKCPVLIGALEGGYRFTKNRTTGTVTTDKPHEDRYFADIACAWRYALENFVKWGIPHEDRLTVQQQRQQTALARRNRELAVSPHAWLEPSQEELTALITS
jgi:hypothetical protein